MRKIPLLIIAYRRVNLLAKLLESLPDDRRIFICVDGPRGQDHKPDVDLVQALVEDFKCNNSLVTVLCREENLGGPVGIPAAIDWAFGYTDSLCILEEDCLPSPLVFDYIDHISDYLSESSLIGGGTLNNFVAARTGRKFKSPFLSVFNHCWGWVICKSSWQKLRPSPEMIDELRSYNSRADLRILLQKRLRDDFFAQLYWLRIFSSILDKTRYHWDYAFCLNLWLNGMYFVAPPFNLVSNMGFGVQSQNSKVKTLSHDLPVAHPNDMFAVQALSSEVDMTYNYNFFDKQNQSIHFGSGPLLEFRRVASCLVPAFLRRLMRYLFSLLTKAKSFLSVIN